MNALNNVECKIVLEITRLVEYEKLMMIMLEQNLFSLNLYIVLQRLERAISSF